MLKALYTHDCDACVLIGRLGEEDVYYCSGEGSVVSRSSPDGPDYASFPVSIARHVAKMDLGWGLRVNLADAFLAGREEGRAGR